MLGAYNASKFGLEGMSDALRIELAPWGVEVVLIEPGAIATPIWETSLAAADGLMRRMPAQTSELYGERIEKAREGAAEAAKSGTPPDAVAKVAERALTARRPRARYLVGTDAKIGAIAGRLLPDRLLDRLLGGSARSSGGGRPSAAARTAVG
jgi:NAD(P)-dependent dehydrogenase (short-subunit alcohol dehydrogenase family)